VIFVPIFIISFFFGKIFGDNWSNSELITRIMLPWLFLSFLHNPVSWIITVLNKQKTLTVANIFLLAGRFLAIWICFKQGLSFTDSIIAYSVISFLYSSFIIVFILNISKNSNSGY
jgi:O-antigen/teichoic acid export membrane protein